MVAEARQTMWRAAHPMKMSAPVPSELAASKSVAQVLRRQMHVVHWADTVSYSDVRAAWQQLAGHRAANQTPYIDCHY
jgi:hypothetical protein